MTDDTAEIIKKLNELDPISKKMGKPITELLFDWIRSECAIYEEKERRRKADEQHTLNEERERKKREEADRRAKRPISNNSSEATDESVAEWFAKMGACPKIRLR